MQVYTARHILPVTSAPRRDGAIVVTDGIISRVGTRAEIEADLPDGTPVHDLGSAIVLPGLVNAHTHLELSWLGEGQLPQGDYVDWLRALLDLREGSRSASPSIVGPSPSATWATKVGPRHSSRAHHCTG